MKIQGTVRGKHTKPILFGILGTKPYIEIEWTDAEYTMKPKFVDMPVRSIAEWNSLEIGDVLLITMLLEYDGKLYPKLV